MLIKWTFSGQRFWYNAYSWKHSLHFKLQWFCGWQIHNWSSGWSNSCFGAHLAIKINYQSTL